MLTILGQPQRFCDGVSRRSFLKIGAFAFGAYHLSLADVLRAESRSNATSSHKAVINIFLGGGPPHQDMWDIKTEAPAEIRGEFKPIATNVPGIQIGEVFPKMAGRPSIGSVVARVQGPADPSVPPFVGLSKPTQHMPWSDEGKPGFLGSAY